MAYADIARNISNRGTADLNRSMRIARTEGHRVQCKADLNCAYRARQMGCDTVKQWNATLDGKTRDSHAAIDKEWKELEEPFSNGLMYPGDPKGKAAEVINCRCSLDDVPRWYAQQGGFKYRRNNITGEIIECKNYAEFKEKYLNNIKNEDKITSTKLPLKLQLFAKKAEDYKTVILPKKEYAHVMSEIATNLTEDQRNKKVFSKHIGDYIYTVENKGFGNYRVIDKIKIGD